MRVLGAALLAGVLLTGAAQAQAIIGTVPPGIVVASDIDGAYEDVGPPRYAPSPYPPRAYGPPPGYGPPPYGPTAYAPPVLPLHEIYRIVRDGGYSPLGMPQQRGAVYTIAVIDLDGEDGRLVIDARNGRIMRFMPAYRFGARSVEDVTAAYGPPAALPPIEMSRPPSVRLPSAIPQARASVPVPKPRAVSPADAQAKIPPAPTAALAAAPAAPAPTAPAVAKPSVTLQPTQAMPAAQGVE